MTEVTDLAALVGALGVGSLGTARFAQGREPRASRAAVTDAMHEVERHRWANSEKSFREAARELATASLVSRMPRREVEECLTLARAASWMNSADADEHGYLEHSGGIASELNACVHAAISIAVGAAWRPWTSRMGSRPRARELAARVTGLPVRIGALVEDPRRSP